MFKRVICTLTIGLAVTAASALTVHARDMSAVPQPLVRPALSLPGETVDPVIATARSYLERGAFRDAYYAAVDAIDGANVAPEIHVLAAKAALARAKIAPLLRKKRWAKRGRDRYEAALALDASNEDALFGLATFALKAPKGLGGGNEAFVALKQRLAAVSKAKALWLEARAYVDRKDLESALRAYEAALREGIETHLIEEYASVSMDAGSAAAAYDRIQLFAARSAPCVSYTLSNLAAHAGASQTQQLAHLGRFLDTRQRHCGREFVALEAAQRAQALAGAVGFPQQQAYFADMAEQFDQDRKRNSTSLDISS